jgi:aminopeptidase YwaD
MNRTETVLRTLVEDIGARPTGTKENEAANAYLEGTARELGYEVTELHFGCRRWEYGPSNAVANSTTPVPIQPGPFSAPLRGEFPVAVVETLEDLRTLEARGCLLLIRGKLAAEPLMPRDFPFYYPDEHREILDLLLDKRPAGVLALTEKHPLCGLSPYPLFEDGNLGLPNAYAADPRGEIAGARAVRLELDSASVPATGRQLIFSRKSRAVAGGPRVVLAAHVDTKYETPGALDNAAGLATAVAVMERLRDAELPFDLDVVPFNGEEYYEVSGQLAYLAHRAPSAEATRLMINLDGLGHCDSLGAFSFYNMGEDAAAADPAAPAEKAAARLSAATRAEIDEHPRATVGDQWISGDHAVFAFRGIPCVAVTSSNLMEQVVHLTHTPADTVEKVDVGLLDATAEVVAGLVTAE